MSSIYKKVNVPFQLYEIDIINAGEKDLLRISKDLGLNLNLDEMKKIKEYFKKKGRNPYDIELQSIAQAWSEHCCYKSSKYYLKQYLFSEKDYDYVISAIKEDSGVVEFDEEYAYVVAFESHNHPSAIEPYGGAATGIGGILRDVLCMGARPVALVDPLFFADLDVRYSELPKGTKHPLYLLTGVVAGIRDYGNRVGIPTVAGMVFFDRNYLTNCIVNVGCVGICKKSNIVPSKAGGPGEYFIMVGGLTGRDGIHGVTFASAELTEESEKVSRGAVQLGDPIIKEPLIHACLEVVEKGLCTGMKDLGGGGLSCVIGEMCFAAGVGAEIWLDKVLLKEKDMAPWEIWISESQERMMLTVKPENVDEVLYIFSKWDLPASVIGKTTEGNVLRIYYKGYKVYEMEIDFVTKGVEYCRIHKYREIERIDETKEPDNYEEIIMKMISHPNVASKEWIIRQYDHEVGGYTVLKPLQGRINFEGPGDSAVIKPTESWRGLALTTDVNPWMTKIDPFWGTASAFDEMIRNLISVNSKPHSFADCLNFGNPEKPERMWDFVQSVKALGWMAKNYEIPCVSGNVSFYNETAYACIPPTPTLFGIGIVEDIRKVITVDFKRKGSKILLVGETRKEFGGSLYSKVTGQRSTVVPITSPLKLRRYADTLLELFNKVKVYACHDLAEGGLVVSLLEMCIASGLGATIDLSELSGETYVKLFSESNTRWLIEVTNSNKVLKLFEDKGLKIYEIGEVSSGNIEITDNGKHIVVDFDKAEKFWRTSLSKFLA